MRKKNAGAEFKDHRSLLLINNFHKAIAAQSQISLQRALQGAADAPAPRFWVSEARATIVISQMLRGLNPTASMFKEKKEMYEEIFRRVSALRLKEPHAPLGDLVFRVVNDSAPKSYLNWQSVMKIVYNIRKTRRHDR